jgi:hypothetical protein
VDVVGGKERMLLAHLVLHHVKVAVRWPRPLGEEGGI